MNKLILKALASAVLTIGLTGTATAAPFLDFMVDEGSVPGNAPGIFTADKINGAYSEKISFTPTGPGSGTFTTHAFADFGQFLMSEGTILVPSQVNVNYGLYAIFEASGTFSPSGPGTAFNATSGSFSLYIDPDQNTTKTLGATGADPVVLGGNALDYLIATASDLGSSSTDGFLFPGVGGFFDFVWEDFTLTIDGMSYFIDPSPFYLKVNVDGDFDTFALAGTQTLTGDVSAVFVVPEPGSLLLLGLGLTALGLSVRRRNNV